MFTDNCKKNFKRGVAGILAILLVFPFGNFIEEANATTIDVLNERIDESKNKIRQLDQEIEEKRKEIIEIGSQKNTLKRTINELDATESKLSQNIERTISVIKKTELTLEKLSIEINETEGTIQTTKSGIGSSLRDKNALQEKNIIEQMLASGTVSKLMQDIDFYTQVTDRLSVQIGILEEAKLVLEDKVEEHFGEKARLALETEELKSEKESVQYTKEEKNEVLEVTESKESEYQRILNEKLAQKKAFEDELFAYEAALKEAVKPEDVPTGNILSWPLDSVYITQNFGKTGSSGRLYASGTHNGVDFRAPIGTKVKSAQSGIVKGVGNTDQYPGCHSYGKWVLVAHPNGLTTLYAHLSSISVSTGQSVTQGQTVGLSGNTGYSTGPHLHLTVFASSGVSVQQYSSSFGCKQASIPLPTLKNAYLDPLSYLQ